MWETPHGHVGTSRLLLRSPTTFSFGGRGCVFCMPLCAAAGPRLARHSHAALLIVGAVTCDTGGGHGVLIPLFRPDAFHFPAPFLLWQTRRKGEMSDSCWPPCVVSAATITNAARLPCLLVPVGRKALEISVRKKGENDVNICIFVAKPLPVLPAHRGRGTSDHASWRTISQSTRCMRDCALSSRPASFRPRSPGKTGWTQATERHALEERVLLLLTDDNY